MIRCLRCGSSKRIEAGADTVGAVVETSSLTIGWLRKNPQSPFYLGSFVRSPRALRSTSAPTNVSKIPTMEKSHTQMRVLASYSNIFAGVDSTTAR
jgi:hypothetical protein